MLGCREFGALRKEDRFICRDPASGKITWTVETGQGRDKEQFVTGHHEVLVTYARGIYKIRSTETGELFWELNTGATGTSPPMPYALNLSDQGMLFYNPVDDKFHLFSSKTGDLTWKITTPADCRLHSNVVQTGNVAWWCGKNRGNVHGKFSLIAMQVDDGQILLKQPLKSPIHKIALAGSTLLFRHARSIVAFNSQA